MASMQLSTADFGGWHPGFAWGRLFPTRPALAELADDAIGLDIGLEEARGFDARVGAGMKNLVISICSPRSSLLRADIPTLAASLMAGGHTVRRVHAAEELEGGDICLFLGFDKIIDGDLAALHTHNLLVREHTLQGEGGDPIPVILLAHDHAALDGLRELKQFILRRRAPPRDSASPWHKPAIIGLCLSFVNTYPDSLPRHS